ncbi:hypothetical protein SAMN04490243_2684 [Robiginitalea myxolifaciens]|uniref:Uncharacterized protein n=1 Tax=Robiginitalea myxolifaciens TaxID=400055 RepID=A0A1I6HG26_9FLAO|nr:hypothetical protein SAMN04490243_2684 [Robiginitalea myxolifaciens]
MIRIDPAEVYDWKLMLYGLQIDRADWKTAGAILFP